MTRPRIAILGPGAVGGSDGADMPAAGHEACLIRRPVGAGCARRSGPGPNGAAPDQRALAAMRMAAGAGSSISIANVEISGPRSRLTFTLAGSMAT